MSGVTRHARELSLADGANSAQLQPSEWGSTNTNYVTDPTHEFFGGTNGQFLKRDTSAADGASWADGSSITGIAEANITDGAILARVASTETISGAWTFSTAPTLAGTNITALSATQLTSGTVPDARIAASSITQHQTSLAILETQITDGAVFPRLAGNETISGAWVFSSAPTFSDMTAGSLLFAGASGIVSQSNSSLFWDNSLKCLGIGTATPTSSIQLGGVALPGDDVTKNWLNITGTFPSNNTAQLQAVRINITSAGSVDQRQRAVDVNLGAGYTGANMTVALGGSNIAASTATAGWTGANANYAGYWTASGTTAGHNLGAQLSAQGSSALNLGILGRATSNTNSAALNVAVAGHALNATVNVAGYFGLRNAAPTLVSSALIADNGAEAVPIFIARDNGTEVFSIADGGQVTLTSGPLLIGVSGFLHGGTNLLEQRNGTSAQAFRVYNTTDGTNKEYITVRYNSNVAEILSTSEGTGTARALSLGAGTIVRWTIQANNHFVPVGNNNSDFGGTSNQVRSVYVGTSLVNAGYNEFTEIADPSAGAANTARLYCKDNGSGKSLLVVRFASGAVQTIATEP